jgi:NAD(P)-dependent dehydrogenase (short-subunit alcohol dehydrogenase family)
MSNADTTANAPHRPVSIVTGAGSGIGAACARLLADAGYIVVLVGRRYEMLESVRASLCDPSRHLAIPADVADSDRAAEVIDRTVDAFGRIDALVLAAGTAPKVPIDQTTEAVLEEAFFVNTFGKAFPIVRAWPVFKRQRAGRVVVVSTIGTLDPFPGFFAYAASKAAADSFVRSMKVEGKAIGVKAFAVNPGAVETEMLRKNFPENVIPRSKALPPEAVAAIVVACATGARDEANGKVIPVPS